MENGSAIRITVLSLVPGIASSTPESSVIRKRGLSMERSIASSTPEKSKFGDDSTKLDEASKYKRRKDCGAHFFQQFYRTIHVDKQLIKYMIEHAK